MLVPLRNSSAIMSVRLQVARRAFGSAANVKLSRQEVRQRSWRTVDQSATSGYFVFPCLMPKIPEPFNIRSQKSYIRYDISFL